MTSSRNQKIKTCVQLRVDYQIYDTKSDGCEVIIYEVLERFTSLDWKGVGWTSGGLSLKTSSHEQ